MAPPPPPYPPLSQGLDSAMSCVMERKGGSAWIMSNLWSRPRSSNFWTSQSRSLSLQTVFFECEYPLIDMTDGHNWARCCKRMAIRPGFDTIQATCCACSTKILLDSCRVFLSRKPKKGSADRVILFVSIRYDEPAAQQPDTLSLLSNKKKSIFVCLAGKLSEFRTLLLNFRSQRLITIVPGKKKLSKKNYVIAKHNANHIIPDDGDGNFDLQKHNRCKIRAWHCHLHISLPV